MMILPAIKQLETAAAVIDAIGVRRLRGLTRASAASITNWRAAGRFPPRTFLVLSAVLAELEAAAPAALWSIDEPAKSDALSGD